MTRQRHPGPHYDPVRKEWSERFDLPRDPETGARRQRTARGRTQTACRGDRRRIEEADRRAGGRTADRQTLAAYLDHWLEVVRLKTAKRGTVATYRTWMTHHILPELGAVLLSRLSPHRCQEWVTAMDDAGLPAKSIHNYAGLLHAALAHAVETDLLPKHPMRGVQLPALAVGNRPVWTAAELAAFLAATATDDYHPAWLLLALTGMRLGEVIALRWQDVDLDSGQVRVERAYTPRNERYEPPKSGKARVLYLDEETCNVLVAHQAAQQAMLDQLAADFAPHTTQRPEDLDLVCLSPLGRRISGSSLRDRMASYCTLLQLEYITLHGLRRTFTTRMLDAGHDVGLVARQLGHATVRVTRAHYYSIEAQAQRRLAAGVRDALLGTEQGADDGATG